MSASSGRTSSAGTPSRSNQETGPSLAETPIWLTPSILTTVPDGTVSTDSRFAGNQPQSELSLVALR